MSQICPVCTSRDEGYKRWVADLMLQGARQSIARARSLKVVNQFTCPDLYPDFWRGHEDQRAVLAGSSLVSG